MTSPAITVYTDSFCGYCTRVLALPQVCLGDRCLGGATELAALDQNGELDRLLAEGA